MLLLAYINSLIKKPMIKKYYIYLQYGVYIFLIQTNLQKIVAEIIEKHFMDILKRNAKK